MNVRLHHHAVERLDERGATEEEVVLKLAYDQRYNIAYIRLEDRTAQVEDHSR